MSARWFYSDSKETHGPISKEDLEALIAGGRLSADHYVVPEGSEAWERLSNSEFASCLPNAAPSPILPPVPGSSSGSGKKQTSPAKETHGRADGLPPVPGGPKTTSNPSHSHNRATRPDNPSRQKKNDPNYGMIIGVVVVVLIAFCGFSGLVGTCSGGSAEGRAITRVLKESHKITATAASRYNGDGGNFALFVAQQYQRVNLDGCPADFRYAYQQHTNAWDQAAPYFAMDTPLNSFLEGLYSGYSGDFSNFGATSNNAQFAAQGIQQTYYQLKALAAGYGATIP